MYMLLKLCGCSLVLSALCFHYSSAAEITVSVFGDNARAETKQTAIRFKDMSECPPCSSSKRSTLSGAVESFWRNDFREAYACACTHLLAKPDDGYAIAIVHALTQGKTPVIALDSKVNLPSRPAPALRKWDVLGPINVGKLEHDSDAAFIRKHVFPSYKLDALDVGSYVLGMPTNSTVLSDLATGGFVKWISVTGNEVGEVRFVCNVYNN
jgi:hypothetical protein